MREIERIGDDEGVIGWAPSDERIGGGIVHHVICLYNEWSNHVVVVAAALLHIPYTHSLSVILCK